jgi:hypothetical protein
MRPALKPVTVQPAVPAAKVQPLRKVLSRTQAKIREDLFRFRTCCADPRASK